MTEEPPRLLHTSATAVDHGGRKLIYFGGSDYFRLAWDRRVRLAFSKTAAKYGHNLSASRMTTGNHPLYGELEEALATFLQFPCTVVTPTGYSASLVAGQIMKGRISYALVDEKAHACVKDGAVLSGAKIISFPHRDVRALKKLVGRFAHRGSLGIFTDGLSAHDGSVAPLAEYLPLLPRDGWMMVDDAHGIGTIGETGRGALEWTGVKDSRIIQTLTLSKAIGSYGGAIAGPAWLREAVQQRSRLFSGGSPPGLPYVGAALRSLEILQREGRALRSKLAANTHVVRGSLDLPCPSDVLPPGPTLAIAPKNDAQQRRLTKALLEAGIYPSLIRYAGGPSAQFFRLSISSAHTQNELKLLTSALSCLQSG